MRAKHEIEFGVLRNTRTNTISTRMVRELTVMGVSWRYVEAGNIYSVEFDGITHLTPGATYGESGAYKLLENLERTGVEILNRSESCLRADNKITTAEAFDSHGVPQPRWCRLSDGVMSGSLNYPAVVKRPEGALGVWNRLAVTESQIDAFSKELLVDGGDELLVQEAVVESLGASIRVVVLDGEVLAATELRAQSGEWRSNAALGGTGSDCVLSSEEKGVAVAAAAAVGLKYAGVDLIRSNVGCLALGVNSGSPFDGAERRTGLNIARAIVEKH